MGHVFILAIEADSFSSRNRARFVSVINIVIISSLPAAGRIIR